MALPVVFGHWTFFPEAYPGVPTFHCWVFNLGGEGTDRIKDRYALWGLGTHWELGFIRSHFYRRTIMTFTPQQLTSAMQLAEQRIAELIAETLAEAP